MIKNPKPCISGGDHSLQFKRNVTIKRGYKQKRKIRTGLYVCRHRDCDYKYHGKSQ